MRHQWCRIWHNENGLPTEVWLMGALKRLRPKTPDRGVSAAQLVLELGASRLRPETKADLTELLSSFSPEPWVFVMLSREKARVILRRINEGDRSGSTAK